MSKPRPTSPLAPTSKPARAEAQIESKPIKPGAIASFADATAALLQHVDLEKLRPTPEMRHQYKLDRMRALLAAMGNPQEALRCVHVAGTKGKGSTCEMIATCLEACGYTVGLYTSPHLMDIRERFRINRRLITEEKFVTLAKGVLKAAAGLEKEHGSSTFFELTTAMAFQFFADEAVDVAVVEVGLGGLLDCTNVITPEVAAVTLIGRDHMQILGDTLEEIALQKAGIIKPGVPALTVPQDPAAGKVIREYAAKVNAPLAMIGEEIEYSHRFEFPPGEAPVLRLNLTTERNDYDQIAVPLRGEQQAANCALALAVIDKLAERGFQCPQEHVLEGLARTKLEGRFELINSSPRILLDGAHNPESMRALMKAIGQYVQYDALLVIFGCAADKEYRPMLQALAMAADKVVFTAAGSNARAAKPEELQRVYRELSDKDSHVAPTLADALAIARPSVNREDLVCITGSFYLVGEAKKMYAARQAAGRRT